MKLLSLSLIFFFATINFAQDQGGDFGNKKIFQISGYNYFLDFLAEKNFSEMIGDVLGADEEYQKSFNPEENVYILFIGIKDLNEWHIVHKEGGTPTERLVAEENIFFVWIDDDANDDYEITYEIKERASVLEKEFNSMKNWLNGVKDEANVTRGTNKKFNYYYNIMKLNGTVSPADIYITSHVINKGVDKYNNSTNIINHERSYYNFSLGVSATNGVEKNFIISNKQLLISDRAKSEWQGKFLIGFNFHFGRDVDAWNPSYEVWTSEFWGDFHKRLNLFVGFELSTRPFDNFFAGVGLNMTKDIQLSLGTMLNSTTQIKSGESIGDINSLQEIKEFFPAKYEPKFYFGLNFSTGMISKMLGL